MKNTLKIMSITVLALSVTSVSHAGKTGSRTGGAGFSKSLAGSGGGAYYPPDDFPTLPEAVTACGGIDNVGSIRVEDEDPDVTHGATWFCAEL